MCAHTTELELDLILVSFPIAPPRFTRTPEDQIGVQGGVASFVCQAGGDPQPKIVWNKKGKKVSNQRFEVCQNNDVFFCGGTDDDKMLQTQLRKAFYPTTEIDWLCGAAL